MTSIFAHPSSFMAQARVLRCAACATDVTAHVTDDEDIPPVYCAGCWEYGDVDPESTHDGDTRSEG